MWAFGTAMVWQVWPDSEVVWQRVVRLLLVSGPYPYFQLMGTAVLMLPLGAAIKCHHQAGTLHGAMAKLGIGAACVCVGSLAWALWRESEVTAAGFASGVYKVPTRPWYFGFYGGLMLLVTVGLYAMDTTLYRSRTMVVLSLLGQSALTVYVSQALILPALFSVDSVISIEGIARITLPLLILILILSLVTIRQYRLAFPPRLA